jgi:streptogramin lyase
MKRVQLFSLVVGLGAILVSEIAFAADVVKLDIMPGSSIRVGARTIAVGQDPPTSTLNNVSITDDGTGAGTLFVAESDVSFAPVNVVVYVFTVRIQLRAQSNLTGTYDRHTGLATATGDFDLKLTSNTPGFNNITCIIPATTLTLSTNDGGGWPFYSGTGRAADNTFLANAVPPGSCGAGFGYSDYASVLNEDLGLPSPAGANSLALVMRMTPPLAPYHIITSIAGNGVRDFSGDGGPATGASLYDPTGVAVDSAGNVFVADFNNQRIRRVDATTGIITTVAGNGVPDFIGDGGLATDASLRYPNGVAVDGAGNLFIADWGNERIRRVDAVTGIISTVAGTGIPGVGGDGGLATGASLNSPTGAAVDGSGNLFIADYGNQRIRRVDAVTGIITTVAGIGVQGFAGDGGLATDASLSNPTGVAVDGAGNVFVADTANQRIRRVDAVTGIITTRSGTGIQGFSGDGGPAASAGLNNPTGVAVDGAGNLFIADFGNQRIRRVDAVTNIIRTRAGNGLQGFGGDGGPSGNASLNLPEGVAVDRFGRLLIADTNNHRIRLVVP